jgi:hypothetical protein
MISVAEFSMRRMHLPRVWKRSARLLPLTCLLSALAFQPPAAWAEGTPGTPPQPKTATDVVREMAPPPPLPTPTPPAGTGRRQREEAKAKAREQAQEKVQKAEQERQQASNDAARNPNDPAKQATDLEKQQKLDEAVTDAARLNDDVAQAEQEYRDAYKEAETAASNLAADTPDKTLKLAAAKRRYEAALEEAKARIARVFAERWNRQRFAEQMERRRQATQQGTQGTPQTQPGGATPGTGGGNIGQAQTPPTAAQVPKINVITDNAGGGQGYNTSGYKIGSSGSFGKGDRSRWGDYQYVDPQDDLPLGGPKLAPVEYVRVCDVYGAGFFYIPGTDTCLKIGGSVRVDLGNGFSFEFRPTIPTSTSACGRAKSSGCPATEQRKTPKPVSWTARCDASPTTEAASFKCPPNRPAPTACRTLSATCRRTPPGEPTRLQALQGLYFRFGTQIINMEAALRKPPDSRRFRAF